MKDFSFLKKPLYSALVFFGTLLALSVGYSNYISSYPANVGTGSGLSSTQWNKMVSGLQTLDTNLSNFSFVGGNIGIGTASPGAKLEVNGSETIDGTLWLSATGGVNVQRSDPAASVGSQRFQDTVAGGKWYFGPVTDNNGAWIAQSFTLDHAGNVGIGTTSPSQRLDLGGGNIAMGWERITNTCSNASSCTATCKAGKQATGGSCLITGGSWTMVENSGGDNYYLCYFAATTTTVVATVYCANIR